MGRRTLLVVVSILIAAIGTGLIAIYVKGADQRAEAAAERRYGPRPAEVVTPDPSPTTRHGLREAFGFTIMVNDEDRVAGLLRPGDLVSVFTTTRAGRVPRDPIAQNVRVISVGSKSVADDATGEQVPNTILGLDVGPETVRALLQAEAGGTLAVAVQGNPPARPTGSP
jgi:hypothetical protein